MLLGSIPPKLDRQHEKAWVLLTSPTCTQLIHSIQSHSHPSQPPVLPSTSPPATLLSSLPPDDIHCQICQSLFDQHKCFFVTCATQDGIWTAFSHPLLPYHMEPGSAPCAPRTTSYPRKEHDTFAFLLPFSISTLIGISKKNDSLSRICASGLPTTIFCSLRRATNVCVLLCFIMSRSQNFRAVF